MPARISVVSLLVLVVVAAGCAGSRETAEPSDALVGTWRYTISTAEGDFGGRITFDKTGGALTGTLTNEIAPDPAELENIAFDGTELSFEFDGGQYGRISADVTVTGDDMRGVLSVPYGGGDVPLRGSRTTGA